MTKSVLVTGGAGFIGSHVVRAFASNGSAVTVLDDLSSGKLANLPEGVTFVEDDVRSPSAARVVRDGKFDVICHLAAQIDVRKSVEDPAYDVAVNIGGSLNLLEAVRQSGKKSTRFIFSSTGGALYGDVETLPTPEIQSLSAMAMSTVHARIHMAKPASLQSSVSASSKAANSQCSATDSRPATTSSSKMSPRRITSRPPNPSPPLARSIPGLSTSVPVSRPASFSWLNSSTLSLVKTPSSNTLQTAPARSAAPYSSLLEPSRSSAGHLACRLQMVSDRLTAGLPQSTIA